MKKITLCIFSVLAATSMFAQPEAQRTTIFTAPAGHKIVTHESSFFLSCDETTLCIVTEAPDGRFYSNYKGVMSGPFTEMREAYIKCDEIEMPNSGNNSSYANTMQIGTHDKFISIDDNGLMNIVFKGKNYGPYELIYSLKISADNTTFFALVKNKDNLTALISNNGNEVVVGGGVIQEHYSQDGTYCMIITNSQNLAMEALMTTDMSEMTPEEQQAFFDKINQIGSQKPEITLYFSDGTKFGPYSDSQANSSNAIFSTTGGKNWHMVYDHKLFINGIFRHDFGQEEWISAYEVWVSSDGKNFAWKTYEKIYFSNGRSYDFPLLVGSCIQNGINQLHWVSLENNTFIKHTVPF